MRIIGYFYLKFIKSLLLTQAQQKAHACTLLEAWRSAPNPKFNKTQAPPDPNLIQLNFQNK